MLVTDKPLYQPGQLIHLRALALQTHDLTPVAKQPLTFEVEDGKGNKVFKKELTRRTTASPRPTSSSPSEVNKGDYRIQAIARHDRRRTRRSR